MSMLGRHHSEETRRKIGEGQRGRSPSQEIRDKISRSLTGRKGAKRSFETRRKIGMNWIGRKHTDDSRIKMIELRSGGIWYVPLGPFEAPYCEKWTEDLKERVRAYWNYQCFECGTPQNGYKLPVHHVHYNKKTCCDGSPHDLIPLCKSCHSITNHNRDYWEDHFTELIYSLNPEGKCFFTREEMASFQVGEYQ